jgi:hypothetical protein
VAQPRVDRLVEIELGAHHAMYVHRHRPCRQAAEGSEGANCTAFGIPVRGRVGGLRERVRGQAGISVGVRGDAGRRSLDRDS